jgi:hypothetical protein
MVGEVAYHGWRPLLERRIEVRRFAGKRAAGVLATALIAVGALPASATAARYSIGPISEVSSGCPNQNAEVEQAVDPRLGYVYELWMGCRGIGFARSTNGGDSFAPPITVPGSGGSVSKPWDPAIAVAPNGTVYASFMVSKHGQAYPVVAASADHGQTFGQVTSLIPPDPKNWGDRDFIAVGPDGTVYVTWDYGPERTSITYLCSSSGSCAFASGDVNAVIQKSTDGGKTFGPMSHISPGFPASGADSAPLVVEPTGRIDVLYPDYPTNRRTYAFSPSNEWFTSSADGGSTWSKPVEVGASAGTMSVGEWWIDGDIGIDSLGDLYATWDTQGKNADGSANDIGWLSYSVDHGATWSAAVQAPSDRLNVPHIVEVAGGGPGTAYVGWLSPSNRSGYAQYMRPFSLAMGWLSAPVQVSTRYGSPSVWPGDTFGISILSPANVMLSWGSATPATGKKSQIFAADVNTAFP